MSSASIVLRYPSDWIVPVHRDHRFVARATERWLGELGLLDTPRARRLLRGMDVGRYGALPFAFASSEALVAITRLLALWSLHDDVLEGTRVEGPRVLVEAIAAVSPTTVSHDPYVRGWQALGQRLSATMSDRWMQRHAERFEDWLASVDAEAELAERAQATGVLPSLPEYMKVRLVNIGMATVCCWIELALGRELPPSVLADPELAAVERLAAGIVTFQNDLAGLDKDVRYDWPNAVRSVAADYGISIAAAIQPVVDLHAIDVATLTWRCQRLVARHGEAVRWWTQALTWMLGGFAQWHAEAEQYAGSAVAGASLRIGRAA